MKITVMGLGLFGGGAGAARYFAERGEEVRVTDLRSEAELAAAINDLDGLKIEYHLGEHPQALFREADLVVVNPGVKPGNAFVEMAREGGAELTTEINIIFELARARIAGVTGSNGKSTVVAMLADCLRADGREVLVGGNIGGSLLRQVQEFSSDGVIVLELSSFQLARLEWIERSPHLAVCTNITPNHLDWHPDFEDYAGAKRNITRFQNADDLLVVNADCPVCSQWGSSARARVGQFSTRCGTTPAPLAGVDGDELILDVGEGAARFMRRDELGLPGEHNVANALAAALGAALLGAAPASIGRGLTDYRGLPHRLEFIDQDQGVKYYNDSIATTPEAAIAALASFESPLVLIAGGSDKGLDFDELGRAAAARCEVIVVTGKTGGAIRAAVERAGGRATVLAAADFDAAFRLAAESARPGWVVLLSPASASFDEFPNFAARGERFRKLVRELLS
jgi:UDP-N-acetylmuramoylalanine--D-glutamate ligase